jgi:hypothetical protein
LIGLNAEEVNNMYILNYCKAGKLHSKKFENLESLVKNNITLEILSDIFQRAVSIIFCNHEVDEFCEILNQEEVGEIKLNAYTTDEEHLGLKELIEKAKEKKEQNAKDNLLYMYNYYRKKLGLDTVEDIKHIK